MKIYCNYNCHQKDSLPSLNNDFSLSDMHVGLTASALLGPTGGIGAFAALLPRLRVLVETVERDDLKGAALLAHLQRQARGAGDSNIRSNFLRLCWHWYE